MEEEGEVGQVGEGDAVVIGGGNVMNRQDLSVTWLAMQGEVRMAVLQWLVEGVAEWKMEEEQEGADGDPGALSVVGPNSESNRAYMRAPELSPGRSCPARSPLVWGPLQCRCRGICK